jgi:hypothetical protein
MRLLFSSLAVALSLCLSGCIEGPSTDARSPEVSGQIIDAKSQQPLPGVVVALHDHPAIAATSDANGHFTLRGTKNFHLFTLLGICSTSFPEGKYYRDTLDVRNVGYAPLSISARQYLPAGVTNVDGGHLTLRDIQLTPIGR